MHLAEFKHGPDYNKNTIYQNRSTSSAFCGSTYLTIVYVYIAKLSAKTRNTNAGEFVNSINTRRTFFAWHRTALVNIYFAILTYTD